ncbi:MAG TPA: tetratricopeptide repeat protein [Thermoanaerobaculia bacterium]|nr:tetratricopeptide repeat protein [Thermoanaerobaculia bacterium]
MSTVSSSNPRSPWSFLALLPGLVLGLLLASPAHAAKSHAPSILDDAAFRTDALAGLDRLYEMDFPAAQSAFARIEERYPDHPVGPLLQGLLPWWQIQLDPEDSRHDAQFLAAMDQVVDRADRRLRRDSKDLDGLFFRSGAFAFRARVQAYRGRWLRAANDGRRALSSLRKVKKLDPDNVDLDFGLGLFDYLADEVPKQHPFLKPFALLLPKGDKARGMAELQRAAEQGRFVQTEAHFALYQLHFLFAKDYGKAMADVSWLREHHPDNPVFLVAQGRIYAQLGQWADANVLFQQVAERQVDGRPGYSGAIAEEALYWLARGEMASRRYADALQYLDRLDYLAQERNYDAYMKAAGRLRRGMTYDALGRRDDALRCYHEVLDLGVEGDVRARAQEFLNRPFAG